jgi:segregation and condensation protein B
LVSETLRALRAQFAEERRGFQLAELASGWVMQSSPDVAEWVTRFANRDVSHRLSAAALETLAIIAYRQPISRAQITALRGVNVDGVVRLLEQRGYIEEAGRAPGPGLPILYGTTELFLDRMGLATLRDLPPIEEFMPPVQTAIELADEMFENSLGTTEDA